MGNDSSQFDLGVIHDTNSSLPLLNPYSPRRPLSQKHLNMPLPSYLKDSAAVLDNVTKITNNPYVVGIGGVISNLIKVLYTRLM